MDLKKKKCNVKGHLYGWSPLQSYWTSMSVLFTFLSGFSAHFSV